LPELGAGRYRLAVAAALSDRDLLAHLVAFDTTSERSNLPLADWICDYLDRPGVRIDRDAFRDAAGERKCNLVIAAGPPVDAASRDGLVLSGHMDVVPAGSGWSSDPFTLVERDGALFARGSADMKGFLALAINLARELDLAAMSQPLVLVLTCDEEVGTLGARHLHDHWPAARPLPRQAIIGEPTELQPVRVHKGHLKARFTFRGTSAHSAYPHLGKNAIAPAARLIDALTELEAALPTARLPSSVHFPEVPSPTLNVGCVHGGTAINVVPAECVVDVGVRLLPGMDTEALIARLQRLAAATTPQMPPEWELLSISPPMETDADAPLFARLCALAGAPAEPAAAYATDAGWLQRMGLECVLFGPGSIRVAHKPDEWVPIADLARAREVLATIIADCCRTSAGASVIAAPEGR
jgi:acetylornithine deacetylase